MASLNKAMLIGNLGKDPELKYAQNGIATLKFSMATTEKYNDKSGELIEKTIWHNVTIFGKLAESINKYLKKGQQVYIEGRINNGSYKDQEGNTRYTSEIIANNVVLLGAKQHDENTTNMSETEPDEIPF
jgi:single-strand DNA-binding protein